MRHSSFIGLVAAVSFTPFAMAETIRIEPGMYEIVSVMKMPMMPNGMTNKVKECISPEEASMEPEDFAKNMSNDGDCSVSDIDQGSSEVSFTFQCKSKDMGAMNGQMQIQHRKTSYSMQGKMQGEMGGMKMDMEMTGEGTRIGDC